MKHPVDTSSWGEFLLKDIATLTNGNKFDKNKMSHDNPSINFVSRTGFNNGISDFVDKIEGAEPYPAGAITLALGGSVGSTFVQPKPFYTGQNVGVIEFENKSEKMKQFVAVVLNKVCSTQFSAFKNEINKHFKRDLSIPLPLKPSADPSNYNSTDIDWNYMETVMSRVTARAKERLANLPQPTDKKKTPVNTSAWGEFKARDLFGPSKLGKYHNPKDLHASDDGYEYICATTMNNGINQTLSCVIGNDLTIPFRIGGGLSLTPSHIIAWGKQNPYFTYHENPCVTSQGMYFVEVKNKTRNQIHFLITVLNKLSSEFSYTNCLTGKIFDELSIPLPLKPSANPSNYDQTDIDWDYMDRFMHGIEEKAHERLVELNSYMNEDD